MHRGARLAVLAIVILAVVGCTAPHDSAPSEPASPASDMPSPTPTPEPMRPALDELVLEPGGLGDLRIGSPVPEVSPELAIVAWDGSACDGAGGTVEGDPYAGYWSSVEPGSVHVFGPPTAFFLITEGGVEQGAVTTIRVLSDIRTPEGIRVGSTRAEVESAYPSPTSVVDNRGLSTVYAVEVDGRRLTMEVANEDTDGYWEDEMAGRVLFMWAEIVNDSPYGIGGGDGGSPCII